MRWSRHRQGRPTPPRLAWLPVELLGGPWPKGASPHPRAGTLHPQGEEVAGPRGGGEINAEAALATLSGGAEGAVPGRANAVQERRIDDPPAKRVDEGHVHRRQATDTAHVHAEIEAVGI